MLEDGDHDQDVQAAAYERLRNGQSDQQPGSGCVRNHLKPGPDHFPDRLGLDVASESVATFDSDSCQQRRRSQKHCRTAEEDNTDTRQSDERAGEQRAGQGSETLDRR